jgi:hypothetical protein
VTAVIMRERKLIHVQAVIQMVNKGTVSEILLYMSLIQFCHISYPHETSLTAVIRD